MMYLAVESIVAMILVFYAFLTGLKIGQKLSFGEKVNNLPITDKISEIKANKEEEKRQEYYNDLMANIDNYDGTAENQIELKSRR